MVSASLDGNRVVLLALVQDAASEKPRTHHGAANHEAACLVASTGTVACSCKGNEPKEEHRRTDSSLGLVHVN